MIKIIKSKAVHLKRKIFVNYFKQERFGDLVVKSGKDFQCQVCGFSAQKKSLLVYHLGTKHGKVCRILQRSENCMARYV